MPQMLCQPRRSRSTRFAGGAIGLDIGVHSAKLAVRQGRRGTSSIISAGQLNLPAGVIHDATQLARCLRPWLQEHCPWGSQSYVCALPSSIVDYEAVAVPQPADSVHRLAQESLEQLLGPESSQVVCDYWCSPAAPDPTHTLHLAWANSAFIEEFTSCLGSSFSCAGVDAAAPALARAAGHHRSPAPSRLVADIGDGELSLVWASGGVANYVRNRIRFATQSAADVISGALGIRTAAAVLLLSEWGLSRSNESPPSPLESAIETHLNDWLQRLVQEIKRTTQFLRDRRGSGEFAELWLCGGGAHIRGLDLWLQQSMKLESGFVPLPSGWRWEAAEPYSPVFTQAVALTHFGEPV